jgi:hypothetical protein
MWEHRKVVEEKAMAQEQTPPGGPDLLRAELAMEQGAAT